MSKKAAKAGKAPAQAAPQRKAAAVTGWDVYIRSLLDCDPCIEKAAIIGVPEGSLWAKSKAGLGQDFALKNDEIMKFASMWPTYKDLPGVGVHAEGVKFIVPVAEENFVLGKSQTQQGLGICMARTTKACIVVLFRGEREAGVKARGAVERIAGHLKTNGY